MRLIKNIYVQLKTVGDATNPNVYEVLSAEDYEKLSDEEKKKAKELETSSYQKITVDGLEWGSYYFKEIKPPAGYANAENVTFKINSQSCMTEQNLECLEPTAKAYINIDKYIDTANYADYINAYGKPVFIFRITELSSMPTEENPNPAPKPNGNTYVRTVEFNGTDTHIS